ncbi:hypothetical protein XELAEV_18032527mg [Xenopus laevis]|uniref:Uncharacterized protein n=1 Tax=Xenopus laevis TaxID=8355 RepID=A0A974HGM7_XENLA|nr:hypothetical protein XELAEV_18032527mg [Xenopus laevis]
MIINWVQSENWHQTQIHGTFTNFSPQIRPSLQITWVGGGADWSLLPCHRSSVLWVLLQATQEEQDWAVPGGFPYISPCGRRGISFAAMTGQSYSLTCQLSDLRAQLLCCCGGGDKLTVTFEPENLVMLPDNGTGEWSLPFEPLL